MRPLCTAFLVIILSLAILPLFGTSAYATCPTTLTNMWLCPTHACIDCSGNNQLAYYYTYDDNTHTCNRGSPITRNCNVNPIRQDPSTSYVDLSCTWVSATSATCQRSWGRPASAWSTMALGTSKRGS